MDGSERVKSKNEDDYRTTAPRAAAVITWNQKKSDFLILINLRHAAIEWVSYNGM